MMIDWDKVLTMLLGFLGSLLIPRLTLAFWIISSCRNGIGEADVLFGVGYLFGEIMRKLGEE